MEGDTLYAHRSWTGICVYRIDFSFKDNQHKITVNQDPGQVGSTDEEEARRVLNNLLNWWSRTEFDHYGECPRYVQDEIIKKSVVAAR